MIQNLCVRARCSATVHRLLLVSNYLWLSLFLSLVSCSSGRPIMLCSWCAVCWRSSSGRWMKKSCTYSSPTRRGRREPTVSHTHTQINFSQYEFICPGKSVDKRTQTNTLRIYRLLLWFWSHFTWANNE